MADGWQYVGQGLAGLIGGYNAGREAKEKRELEDKKLKELVLASNLKEAESGYSRAPDGKSLAVNPNVYTEGTPEWNLGKRRAELKRMASAGGGASALKLSQIAAAKQALADGKLPETDFEVPSGYSNMVAPPKPISGVDTQQLLALGLITKQQADAMGPTKLPTNALTALKQAKPDPVPGEALVAEYEKTYGPGSSRGLKPPDISSAVQRTREQKFKQDSETAAREKKEAEAAEKAAKALDMKVNTASVVSEDINRAKSLIKSSKYAAGPIVGLSKVVPGTPANRLGDVLAGIKSNLGFDKLQAMRDSSPTGGALGPVSDAENAMLQSTMGKIDAATNEDDLIFNLDRLEQQYKAIIYGNPSDKRAAGKKKAQRTETGRFYSPSRNQTKITYSEGPDEVVSGKQTK